MFNSTEHDDLLYTMLKECETLPIFLHQIFGFLNRRTDFYHIAPDVNSPIGLLPGLAEETIKQMFNKWKPMDKVLNNQGLVDNPRTPPNTPQSLKLQKSLEANANFTKADFYNGAAYDNYCWSQALLEVDINIIVPENTRAKNLSVKIQSKRISVKLNNGTVLLEGELCEKCKFNDTIWSLESRMLYIHLDKSKEVWWNCLITSEPKLDLITLDFSRPFEELSEEAQAKIEELQWNQEKQRLSLLSSHKLQMQDMLKETGDWNVE